MFRLVRFVMVWLIVMCSLLITAGWLTGQTVSADQVPLVVSQMDIASDIYLVDVNRRMMAHAFHSTERRISLSLSPNNEQVAFIARPSGAADVFSVNFYSGMMRQITHTPYEGEAFAAWSPDGRKIAYTALVAGARQNNIFIADLADGSVRQLTNNVYGGNTPSWSPDGRYIVFVSGTYMDTTDLYVAEADCRDDCQTKQRRLTRMLGTELTPAWSPDGQQVAFLVISGGGKLGIYTTSTACIYRDEDCLNQTPRLIISGNSIMSPLIWSGDSQRLIFQQMENGQPELYRVDTNCGQSTCIASPITHVTRSFLYW